MMVRIVRLTFEPDKIDEFLRLFKESRPRIRAFNGCEHLELWQDDDQPSVFTTYSRWESLAKLNRYRESTLFRNTWGKVKPLFSGPPVAHSYCPIIAASEEVGVDQPSSG